MQLNSIAIRHDVFYDNYMSRKKYYAFTLKSGEVKLYTIQEAIELKDPEIDKRIREIISNSKIKRMKHDGFVAGYQENIKAHAGGRLEYNRMLKERGLQEIGYDYIPKDSTRDISPCANPEFAKLAKEVVPDLSDSEVDAIKTGDLFKD